MNTFSSWISSVLFKLVNINQIQVLCMSEQFKNVENGYKWALN